MAVNTCNSYDETTSWRSGDVLINITKSASSAGDLFSSEQLVKNCNNNNSNSSLKDLITERTRVDQKAAALSQFDVGERQKSKEELSTNINDLKDQPHSDKQLDSLQNTPQKNMKLIELNCHPTMDVNVKEESKSLENDSIQIDDRLTTDAEKLHQIPQTNVHSTTVNNSEEEQVTGSEENEVRDPEWVEERFRVDRRKLEQMLQGNTFFYVNLYFRKMETLVFTFYELT